MDNTPTLIAKVQNACRAVGPYLCIAVLGGLIYSNSLHSEFFFDDFSNILHNTALRNVSDFKPMWQKNATRILPYYTFALNLHLNRWDVFGYHVVNVAIHLATGLLAYWLVVAIAQTPTVKEKYPEGTIKGMALCTALIFIIHPIQTQAVTYIVQRISSLTALFYLSTMALYLQYRLKGNSRYLFAAILMNILAMFCKETSFTLPFALLLCEFFFFDGIKGDVRSRIKKLIPFFMTLVIIPLLLVYGISHSRNIGGLTMESTAISRPDYFLTQLNVLCTYLRLAVLPVNQNVDYDYPLTTSLWDAKTLMCGVLLLLLLLAAVRYRHRNRLAAFGILFFFLTISVESSVIPINDVIQEHRLYLPLFGLSLAFSAVAGAFWQDKRKVYCLLAVCIVVLGTMTYLRNEVWKTEEGMWQDVIAKSPHKARGYHNLGNVYVRKGKDDLARDYLNKAIKLDPANMKAVVDLAAVSIYNKDYAEAHRLLNKALARNPENPAIYNNLGVIFKEQNMPEKAEGYFLKALEYDPSQIETLANLASFYREKKRYRESLEAYQKLLAIDPLNHKMALALLKLYFEMGNKQEAMAMGKSILEKARNADEICDFAGVFAFNSYSNMAMALYNRAHALAPRSRLVYRELGKLYGNLNQFDLAIQTWEKGLRLYPEDEEFTQLITVAKTLMNNE